MKVHSIAELVKSILENKPATRNSDYTLWLEVLKEYTAFHGCSALLRTWTVEDFLAHGHNLVPCFESVSRARRKIQAKYPELRGSREVQEARAELEEEYREFAVNGRV